MTTLSGRMGLSQLLTMQNIECAIHVILALFTPLLSNKTQCFQLPSKVKRLLNIVQLWVIFVEAELFIESLRGLLENIEQTP